MVRSMMIRVTLFVLLTTPSWTTPSWGQAPRPPVTDPTKVPPEMSEALQIRGIPDLKARLDEAIREIESLKTAFIDQKKQTEALQTQFSELLQRLRDMPPMRLKGALSDPNGGSASAAILEIGGESRFVRVGGSIHFQPTPDKPLLLIHVKEIREGSATVEVGPWRHEVIVD